MGHLFKLYRNCWGPQIELLAWPELEREDARSKASSEFSRPNWSGPQQAIFLHCDGQVELWGRELLEPSISKEALLPLPDASDTKQHD